MATGFRRLVSVFQRRYDAYFAGEAPLSFAVRSGGAHHVFGRGEPAFTLVAHDGRAVAALATLDSLAVGEAYLSGRLDVEGDLLAVLSLRALFRDRHPLLRAWRFARPLLMGQVRSDAAWIAEHYDEDPDFYLLFLDRKWRAYSQGVFEHEAEPLEAGIERKLEFALEAVGAREGQHVLDVGGGWGAFNEFAGRRGVRVTSLTLSRASERFVGEMIARLGLPCRVVREHLFEHRPAERYDAIVNLGVTEHLPHYGKTLRAYERLLKPGGRVALDASAARRKYDVGTFQERHVFPGNGSPVCMHDYLRHVSRSAFSLCCVLDDTRNYEITTRHWAERLDAHREEIERRWGKAWHRRFQVYLWGCVDAFRRDVAQAYRWVLELPPRRTFSLPAPALRGDAALEAVGGD